MKTTLFNQTKKVLFLCLLCLGVISCEKETESEDFQDNSEEVSQELPSSTFMTLEEFDTMSENLLEGESIASEEKSSKNLNDANNSKTRLSYQFDASVTRGRARGANLSGKLDVTITMRGRYFNMLRGKLTQEDGTKSGVRGAITQDGFVYILTYVRGVGKILGVGQADENGNLKGPFLLRTRRGYNRGNWTATLEKDTPPKPTIVDLAVATPALSTLVEAITQAGLVDALNGEGPLTVFAPTNDAFAALSALPEGDALIKILTYHVAPGKLKAADLLKQGSVKTLQGEEITIEKTADGVILNGKVKVIIADIEASNGVVHVIDGVLLMEPVTPLKSIVEIAVGNPDFSTLVGALKAADLVDALSGDGPFTVFAPTNDAFAALEKVPDGDLLKEVLMYHVASGKLTAGDLLEAKTVTTLQGKEVTIEMKGDKVLLNGSVEVAVADIEASNGIIHVITGILLPPTPPQVLKSILELAVENPDFSTLVGAVKAAGLVDALSGDGPFTVFAPTNDAFAALEKVPDGAALKEVLMYHVASGKYTANDLITKQTITSLQGTEVTIEVKDRKVFLNGNIEVIGANIEASNGIVHVISGVLIP